VSDGALIGKFMAYFREPYVFTRDDLTVSMVIARQLAFAVQRNRTDQQLREREAQLAAELAAARKLQALSLEMAGAAEPEALYDKLIDAAVSIMHSDFGSMQQYYPHLGARGELKLLGASGLHARGGEVLGLGTRGLLVHLRRRHQPARTRDCLRRGEQRLHGRHPGPGAAARGRHPRGAIDAAAVAPR
jgi:hypothetical protein